jgi:hypothetical protein
MRDPNVQLYPFTARFFAAKDPARLNIEGQPDRVFDIWYQRERGVAAAHFGHSWTIQDWAPEDEGKWTFNRSDVAIVNNWWPAIYQHDSLAALLEHLEQTFVEGVPANEPN